jgi:hypothetical protein
MLWLGGFEFEGFAFHEEEGVRLRRHIEETQGVLTVFAAGNADEFVQDGRLLFPCRYFRFLGYFFDEATRGVDTLIKPW